MAKTFFNFVKTAKFQLTCILFLMVYVIGILTWEHKREVYGEKIYPILKVQDQVKQLAYKVNVGLHINNFPIFSFNSNEFTMDAFVWFKYPVGTESLSTIEKFDFQNGKIIHKSKPIIKLIDDDVVVGYQIIVEFKAYLDYKNFPLGDHRLNIILDNRTVTPNELVFTCELNNFVLSDDILVSSWIPTKKIVQSGYVKSALKENDSTMQISYPCVVFTIDFNNNTIRNLMTLYFPMFVVFFICLFSLMIDLKEYLTRLTIISTAMPILVLFRTVIVQLSPTIGGLTKVDFCYFLLVFSSLLILLFQAYLLLAMKKIVHYNEETRDRKIFGLEKYNNLVFILILVLLIAFLTYDAFQM